MTNRQFCKPHVLNRGMASPMRRVAFEDGNLDEAYYQRLLFEYPSLLPVDEIEPLFGPLIPLAREVRTSKGSIDVLYVNPEGYLTLVETKLWRNPEARREVVAQVIDYATAMSRWTYQDLRDAVRSAGTSDEDPLLAAARDQPDFDEARFIDSVTRNLTKGRFLLLIVGDGIQESVEHLADTLSRSPQLGFVLALAELAVYRIGDAEEPLIVQPRLLARTREIVRAIVEIRGPSRSEDIAIVLPDPDIASEGGKRRRLLEEVFMEGLAKATSPLVVNQFREFLRSCEGMGIELTGKGQTVGLFWREPNTGERFTFGSVYANGGWIEVKWVPQYYERSRLDHSIADRYIQALASLVPDGRVEWDRHGDKNYPKAMRRGYAITVADVLPDSGAWLDAIRGAMTETENAANTRIRDE